MHLKIGIESQVCLLNSIALIGNAHANAVLVSGSHGGLSAAEFVVALSASAGFLAQIGRIDINWSTVGGLALGGVIAAPVAARLVGRLPAKYLGIIVAVGIIVLNAIQIIRA